MEISIVKVPKETICLGDAMRDIYNRKLITSDFLLVHGDLVSNVRVDEVVKAYKDRFKANKDNIMTMLLKESGPEHRTRYVCSSMPVFRVISHFSRISDPGVTLRYLLSIRTPLSAYTTSRFPASL